jgi:iron complex transport system substrate-binding protein
MLFSAGAGDKIVGVVAYSDFPKAALAIESVGSYHAINMEQIILLNPDLIIAWKGGNRLKDIEKLQQLGFKILYSEPYKLTDIPQEIRNLGKRLHTQTTANRVATHLENKLQSLIETYQEKPIITAYYQIWNRPLMTINGAQSISQAMNICGAKNVFADLPMLAAEVSIESVIQQNPDSILLGGKKEMQQGWLKEWQKWPTINAVKNQQIFLLDADNFQRPTARLIESIDGLCQKIDQVRAAKNRQMPIPHD